MNNHQHYRVIIGPNLTWAETAEYRKTLAQKYQINQPIIRINPERVTNVVDYSVPLDRQQDILRPTNRNHRRNKKRSETKPITAPKKTEHKKPITKKTTISENKAKPIVIHHNLTKPKLTQDEKTKLQEVKSRKTETIERFWSIQVASYRDYQLANELKRKLETAKFPIYIENINLNNHQHYRVIIGPNLTWTETAEYRKTLARKYQINQSIIRQGN